MSDIMTTVKNVMLPLALEAMSAVEAQAFQYVLVHGTKSQDGEAKRAEAKTYLVQEYHAVADRVPFLKGNAITDAIIEAAADLALNEAWQRFGDLLNTYAHLPVNTDTTLPSGEKEGS